MFGLPWRGHCAGFGVLDLVFRVQGVGFRVSGCRASGKQGPSLLLSPGYGCPSLEEEQIVFGGGGCRVCTAQAQGVVVGLQTLGERSGR